MAAESMTIGQAIGKANAFATKSTHVLGNLTGFAILVLVALQVLAHFSIPVWFGRTIGYEPLAYTAIAWWAVARR